MTTLLNKIEETFKKKGKLSSSTSNNSDGTLDENNPVYQEFIKVLSSETDKFVDRSVSKLDTTITNYHITHTYPQLWIKLLDEKDPKPIFLKEVILEYDPKSVWS